MIQRVKKNSSVPLFLPQEAIKWENPTIEIASQKPDVLCHSWPLPAQTLYAPSQNFCPCDIRGVQLDIKLN